MIQDIFICKLNCRQEYLELWKNLLPIFIFVKLELVFENFVIGLGTFQAIQAFGMGFLQFLEFSILQQKEHKNACNHRDKMNLGRTNTFLSHIIVKLEYKNCYKNCYKKLLQKTPTFYKLFSHLEISNGQSTSFQLYVRSGAVPEVRATAFCQCMASIFLVEILCAYLHITES